MIRLFAENPEQANPNLALRWCVDKETLDELKKKGVKNPQLLLVVAQHLNQHRLLVKEIERKLVPLDQAMEWLEFNRSGRHTIHATIVWDDNDPDMFRAQWLLNYSGWPGTFEWEMLDYYGGFSTTRRTPIEGHSLDRGSLDVIVAEEFFAKESPVWLKWWVNLWFDALNVPRPANQCSFRRRKWFVAFPIQPIPVFIWVLLKSLTRLVAALALVLCGMRRISFKPVIRPFGLCLHNVWYDMGSSIFLKDKEGEWRFAYVAGLISRWLQTIWRAFVPSPSPEELKRRQQAETDRILEKSVKRALKEKDKREREQREFEALYEGLQDVTCIGVPLRPKLELLPERRRTFHLRYRGLKASVCKQYPAK